MKETEMIMYMDYDRVMVKVGEDVREVCREAATEEELHFMETGESGDIKDDNSGYSCQLGSWIIVRNENRKNKIMQLNIVDNKTKEWKMERSDWKFESGTGKIHGVCPICGGKMEVKGDGGIDVSGRIMGSWVGCAACHTAIKRS